LLDECVPRRFSESLSGGEHERLKIQGFACSRQPVAVEEREHNDQGYQAYGKESYLPLK